MSIKSFEVTRYSKPISMFKLKENDEVVSVSKKENREVVVITNKGYALKYNTDEIPVVGLKTSGVKCINLSQGDYVISGYVSDQDKEYLSLFTDKNTSKRIKEMEILKTSRAKKGSLIIKTPKSKEYNIIRAYASNSKTIFGIVSEGIGYIKSSDINIMDKNSVGSSITKKNIEDIFVVTKLKSFMEKKNIDEVKEEAKEENENQAEQKKEVVNLTMSDFFEEFKI